MPTEKIYNELKADQITNAAPDDVSVEYQQGDVDSFTSADALAKAWYLRGKIGG